MQIWGWEFPEGGPIACTKVHTLFTDIAPVHLDLNDCFTALEGAVFLQGSDLNNMIAREERFCVETGVCTFQDEQSMAAAKTALKRVWHPLRKK